MAETLRLYQTIIEGIREKIARREPLGQEEKFAYYEAVHYVDLHNFHAAAERPIEERKPLYRAVTESHRKLHKIEKRVMGSNFKDFGIHDPAIDLENRRAYL